MSSNVASLTIKSHYANIFVFIDCENNQFLMKSYVIIVEIWIAGLKFQAGYAADSEKNLWLSTDVFPDFSKR